MSYISNSHLIINTQFTQQIRSKQFKTNYFWVVSGYMDKIPETKTHHVKMIYI